MTPEQHGRWLDFATRMALHAHSDATQAERDTAEAIVRDYIEGYELVAGDIHGWDGEGGKVYLCDSMDTRLFDLGHLGERRVVEGEDEDAPFDPNVEEDEREPQVGDEYEEVRTTVGDIVSASVRAGVDIAVKPSAGVIGYDLADIRAMYPEGIPDWVAEFLPDGHDAEAEPEAVGLWL